MIRRVGWPWIALAAMTVGCGDADSSSMPAADGGVPTGNDAAVPGLDAAPADAGPTSALCFFPDANVYFPSPALGDPADTSAFAFGRVGIQNCSDETIGFSQPSFGAGTDDAFAFEFLPFSGTTTLIPNEAMFIDLRFAPESGGARSGTLQIPSDLGTHQISLTGTGIPDPQTCLLAIGDTQSAAGAGATSHAFIERTAVGESVTATVLISNIGRSPCTISNIALTDPDGVLSFPYPSQVETPIVLAFRQLKLINLEFSPTAAGEHTATLTMHSNDTVNGPHTMTIHATGY